MNERPAPPKKPFRLLQSRAQSTDLTEVQAIPQVYNIFISKVSSFTICDINDKHSKTLLRDKFYVADRS